MYEVIVEVEKRIMEIPDKTEPGNENRYKEVDSKGHEHPEAGYGVDEIAEAERKQKKENKSIVTNTGLAPGEEPDASPGADIDAASS